MIPPLDGDNTTPPEDTLYACQSAFTWEDVGRACRIHEVKVSLLNAVEAHCETSRLPHFLYAIGSQITVRLSALRAGRPLPPGRFLVLISVRLSRPQGHSAAGRIGSIKKYNDIFGNRSRDLPACASTNYATACPTDQKCVQNINGISEDRQAVSPSQTARNREPQSA
jgi:hypothetical protein